MLSSARRNFFLAGVARVAVGVAGTFEQPQVTGTASVTGASLAVLLADERLTATEVNGSVRFNTNQAMRAAIAFMTAPSGTCTDRTCPGALGAGIGSAMARGAGAVCACNAC